MGPKLARPLITKGLLSCHGPGVLSRRGPEKARAEELGNKGMKTAWVSQQGQGWVPVLTETGRGNSGHPGQAIWRRQQGEHSSPENLGGQRRKGILWWPLQWKTWAREVALQSAWPPGAWLAQGEDGEGVMPSTGCGGAPGAEPCA